MQHQLLRNAVMIAVAFDASAEEFKAAHDMLTRLQGGTVDPAVLVHSTVDTITGTIATTGTGEVASPAAAAAFSAQQAQGTLITGTGQGTPLPEITLQLDKNGLPWDARIHSSSKNQNQDGTWRIKKGTDKGVIAKVEAELKAAIINDGAGLVSTAPNDTNQVYIIEHAGNVPAAPALPPAPPAPKSPFTLLVEYIAANKGQLTDEYVTQVVAHYNNGDGTLQNIAGNAEVVKAVHDWFVEALKAA